MALAVKNLLAKAGDMRPRATHSNLNGIMLPSSGEVMTSFRNKMQNVTKVVVCAACFIYKYFHRKNSFIA